MEQKHSSKQALPITYTLWKIFFAVATFEVCKMFLFRRNVKNWKYNLVCTSLLCISAEKKTE